MRYSSNGKLHISCVKSFYCSARYCGAIVVFLVLFPVFGWSGTLSFPESGLVLGAGFFLFVLVALLVVVFLVNLRLKREIASRKAAESRLVYNENLFRKVFEMLPVGLWIADKDGKLVEGNPEGVRIWGGSPLADPEKYAVLSARHLPDHTPVSPGDWSLYRTIARRETITDELIEIDAFDGEKRVVMNHTAPVLNDKGELQAAIVVNQDMTRLKTMERDLIKSQNRYRALFENNPIQTIIVDREARVVMHNFAGKKPHGALPVVGEVMYRDYAAKHQKDMYQELMDCMAENTPREFIELRYNERYLNILIAPYSEGAIITLMDVTHRKQLADQKLQARKMEAVTTLAGGIAHEFNNILSIILGNLELVMDEIPQWDTSRSHLDEIETAGLRARDVVRQLLGFTRGALAARKVVHADEVVRASINLLRGAIPKAIELAVDIPEEAFTVRADPDQLHQVIINLATNGLHAMEAQSAGRLCIALEHFTVERPELDINGRLTPGNYVVLAVSDTGEGIDSAVRKKMFDPYFTTRDVGKGTGMGLSVVHGIVQGHDGAIRVSSHPGKGTVVRVFLPAAREENPEATVTDAPAFSRTG